MRPRTTSRTISDWAPRLGLRLGVRGQKEPELENRDPRRLWNILRPLRMKRRAAGAALQRRHADQLQHHGGRYGRGRGAGGARLFRKRLEPAGSGRAADVASDGQRRRPFIRSTKLPRAIHDANGNRRGTSPAGPDNGRHSTSSTRAAFTCLRERDINAPLPGNYTVPGNQRTGNFCGDRAALQPINNESLYL